MSCPRKNYDDAVRLYEAGFSVAETAAAFGVTRQAMHMILRRRDVRFRSRVKLGSDNHFYRGGAVRNANLIVKRAVAKGVLAVGPCEVCGLPPAIINGRQRIHAHHDDYNYLLKVRWLCKKHHDDWHKHNKPIPRAPNAPKASRLEIAQMGGRAYVESRTREEVLSNVARARAARKRKKAR